MATDIESETTQLEEYWHLRNEQMELDRIILRLTKPKATTDQIKWVSNEPKVFYETAVALISSFPPRFRLPLTIDFTPEEKKKMNKAERMIVGIFRSLDQRQWQNGWLRQLAYWSLSGWTTTFEAVLRKGKDVQFIADIWDPITVYPEWDSDALVKCIRSFEVDKRTAARLARGWQAKGLEDAYREDDKKSMVKVINYWLNDRGKIFNAIMLGGKEIKKIKEEKQFKSIPIDVRAIGVPDQTAADWPVRFGESIIATNRDMYEYENAMISLMATIMAETAYPNVITKTQTGAPAIKDQKMKGYGERYSLKLNESIELLKHAATPGEVNELLSYVVRQKQKASFADTVYGGIPNVEISGFALSQYMAAIKYKIGPYLNMMQGAISHIASDLLRQYEMGDGKAFPKIALSTTNPTELKKGLFFVEEFSPKDVPESKFVEVTIPITSAIDKTQQIIYARQAMEPPQLLSRETLWDELLDVQDSEQEYTRIIQDQMLEDPMVKQIAVIEALRNREKLYRNAKMIPEAEAMKGYIMQLELQLGMRQGIPTTPGASGAPSQFSPPEAGASPDLARAAVGVPPPSPRRPESAGIVVPPGA